jgi:hypothetical protein
MARTKSSKGTSSPAEKSAANLGLEAKLWLAADKPFTDSHWFRKDDDIRWRFSVPPKGNANFAWVQHFILHFAQNLVPLQLC